MEIVKVGILGVTGVMIALQFKNTKPEISLYMGFALCLIIFTVSLDGLFQVLHHLEALQSYMNTGNSYFKLLFKSIGITYICEVCASICKDAGYAAVAGQIEIFGKLSILFIGMPVLTAIVENISAIAGS